MTITPQWRVAIDTFIEVQAAAGSPTTTQRCRRQHLQHLAARIGLEPWHVTADALTAYAAAQDWARETRRGRRATFTAFWAWAIATERTTTDPSAALPKIKPGDPDPRPVPDQVYLAALIKGDADEQLWIDLAAEHGLRRAEIARIHANDLTHTLLGTDLIVHGKGGKNRRVPLTGPMTRALSERAQLLDGGYLWPGDEDGHVSARWLGRRISRLLDGPWTIHKLRHRAATRFWIAATGDPYAVADLMGWANLNMVRTYVQQPTDRLRAIVHAASRAHA